MVVWMRDPKLFKIDHESCQEIKYKNDKLKSILLFLKIIFSSNLSKWVNLTKGT